MFLNVKRECKRIVNVFCFCFCVSVCLIFFFMGDVNVS